MVISFNEISWNEYLFGQKNDKQKLNKINELLKDISRSPFEGIGKPEALKFKYAGYWSRRIDSEHRLVYSISTEEVIIISCRFHLF
jgi:toxin YoeB